MPQKTSAELARWCCTPLTACRRRPPALSADSSGKRAADTVIRVGDAAGGWLLVAVVVGMLAVGSFLLPERGELAVDLAAFVVGSGYCLLNFWRCREPHCIVSGVGWSLLAGLTLTEVALGRSLIGGTEELVFVGILGLAFAFEAIWRAVTGTNALVRPGHHDDRREAACP